MIELSDVAAALTVSGVGLVYFKKEIGWLVQAVGCVLWIYIGYQLNTRGLIWLNIALGSWGFAGTIRLLESRFRA